MESDTFTYSGSSETYSVSDLAAVRLFLDGAGGEDGEDGDDSTGAPGGVGGRVEMVADVSDVDELTVYVGGGNGNTWGLDNGGAGGTRDEDSVGDGGNGGGSTAVTTADSTVLCTADAGGGGGGGSSTSFFGPGGGGGARGGDGGPDGRNDGTAPGEDAEGDGFGGDGGSGAEDGADDATSGDDGGAEVNSSFEIGTATLTDGGGNNGDGEFTIEHLEPPSDVAADEARADEIDLSWSASIDDPDEYVVLRDGSKVGTTANTSFTDDGLTNGKKYQYEIIARADDGAESEPTDPVSATTDLPATPIDGLTATTDDVDINLGDQADNNTEGEYILFRSEKDGDLGSQLTTLPLDTSTHVDTDVDEAVEYFYTLRRDTGDETADSDQVSIQTDLSAPENVTVDNSTFDTRLVVTWDKPDAEGVEHTVTVSSDGRDIVESGRLAETSEHETEDVVPNQDNADSLTVTVTALKNGVDSSSDAEATATTIDFADGSYTVALRLDGDLYQLDRRFEATPQWRQEPSAITSWTAEIPDSPSLEELALPTTDVFIWFDKELLFRGEFNETNATGSSGTMDIRGDDTIKRLKRGGGQRTYENIETVDAVDKYANEFLDDWDVDVRNPVVTVVDENLTVQDAATGDGLAELFAPGEDYPAALTETLDQLQTTWVDASTADAANFDGTIFSDEGYTGSSPDAGQGEAIGIETTGEFVEWTFDLDHEIPGPDAKAWIRDEAPFDSRPEVEFSVDGTVVATLPGNDTDGGIPLNWTDITGGPYGNDPVELSDLGPGEVTIRAEVTDGADNPFIVDRATLEDSRFDHEFDNAVETVDGVNVLDGPELYSAVPVDADTFDQAFNVREATLNIVMDDTSNDQAIALSNDDGQSFISGNNTAALSADFDAANSFGTIVQGRVTLSGWEPDGPQAATPRYGYAGQSLSEWQLAITTDDRAVIDEKELVGSHFENLQRLCDEGNLVFVPEYHEEELRLLVLAPGQETRTAEWTRTDHTRTKDTSDYANSLTAYGAIDADSDDEQRIVATARSESEIDRVGAEVEGTPLFESDVESREQLRNAIRTKLSKLIAEDQLTGTVEIIPKPLTPGFAYEVSALDGGELALWAVDFGDRRDPQGSLEFGEPDDLASVFASIRASVRDIK